MAHPGQQVPPRAFSPAQHSGQVYNGQPVQAHSPAAHQPGYALPGAPPQGTAPRLQGPPGRAGSFSAPNTHSQPGSPYSAPSPGYGPASPSVSTPTNAPSPSYQNLQPAPSHTPQPHFAPMPVVNRNPPPNPNINTSFSRPSHLQHNAGGAASPTMGSPLIPHAAPSTPGHQQPQQQYTNQAFAPAVNAPSTPGAMGPPTGRPQREYEYDVTDSLMGTGVNIRDEENALADYYAGSTGSANEPGNRASFYGTSFADQPGVDPGSISQKEFEAQEAERVWNESASRLAATRAFEHNDPFLNYGNLHARMDKIAKGYGLELNLDNKNNPQQAHVQKSRNVTDYAAPKLTVTTKVGPDGAIIHVNGSVVPTDSFLADQLNLLSLGTKHRVRVLMSECDELATHRQQSSHGVIPMCWSDDGIPLEEVGLYDPTEAEENGGGEGNNGANAASNGAGNPRKRVLNPLSQYLRDVARDERNAEEERMRKRQKRQVDEAIASTGTRAGSTAPATPGSSAPEPDKAPTKKEQKKIAAQKHDASAESVNSTTAKFLGGGKKKYSWMTGGANTPTRTPSRAPGGGPGTPASVPTPKPAENVPLTAEPRSVMGAWRESGEKGKNIQVRDWITALERDGKDKLALYKAYNLQTRP